MFSPQITQILFADSADLYQRNLRVFDLRYLRENIFLICSSLRPEKIRGLRQILNREQNDEVCDATKMIVAMQLTNKK